MMQDLQEINKAPKSVKRPPQPEGNPQNLTGPTTVESGPTGVGDSASVTQVQEQFNEINFFQENYQFDDNERKRLFQLSPEKRKEAFDKYELRAKVLDRYKDQPDHPVNVHKDVLLNHPTVELEKMAAGNEGAMRRFEIIRVGGSFDELFAAFSEQRFNHFERVGLIRMAEEAWDQKKSERVANGLQVDEAAKQAFLNEYVVAKLVDPKYVAEQAENIKKAREEALAVGDDLRSIIDSQDADTEITAEQRTRIQKWWARAKDSPYLALIADQVSKAVESLSKSLMKDSDFFVLLDTIFGGRGGGSRSLERGESGEPVVGLPLFKEYFSNKNLARFGVILSTLDSSQYSGIVKDKMKRVADIQKDVWTDVKDGKPEAVAKLMSAILLDIFGENLSEMKEEKWEFFSRTIGQAIDVKASGGLGIRVKSHLNDIYTAHFGDESGLQNALLVIFGSVSESKDGSSEVPPPTANSMA